MKYSLLGSSGLSVSRICLGSMTWGLQNNQQEAEQQIEFALAKDINFIDTAEIYAVPPSPDTYGKTETIIGNWLGKNKARRDKIILASKIAGGGISWIRAGENMTSNAVINAVDASLIRLQTDYIDLFQLHWPNRTSPHFGKHWPSQIPLSQANSEHEKAGMLDILQGLQHCIDAGKIRFCGLSNESPWGLNTYLKLSEKHNLPKMVSMQNEFNLLHTKDWPYLIENCLHENIAYLPWSPLATGLLTGKYLNGNIPAGSRWTFSQRNGLFRDTPMTHQAVAEYVKVAEKHGYTPAQLALAWCDQMAGVTSTIIGATNTNQLSENIAAFSMPLNEAALTDINKVIKQYPVVF